MAPHEPIQDILEVLGEERLGCVHAVEGVEQLGRRRGALQPRRPLPGKEPRHEIGAVFRHLDDRLVHQVLQHVLPADVDDEGHPGAQRRDVGEILIGADTEVHAVRRDPLLQLRNHLLERRLVRDEIVGSEKPVCL